MFHYVTRWEGRWDAKCERTRAPGIWQEFCADTSGMEQSHARHNKVVTAIYCFNNEYFWCSRLEAGGAGAGTLNTLAIKTLCKLLYFFVLSYVRGLIIITFYLIFLHENMKENI